MGKRAGAGKYIFVPSRRGRGARGIRRGGSSSSFRANSVAIGGGNRFVRYLAVVNRVRKRCVLPDRGGAAGCRRIVPRLITVRRDTRVRNLLVVLGAINNSIRTNLTVTRLLSAVGAPATSLILNNNRSVNIPLTISYQGDFVIPDTAVAIRPIHLGNLILNIPRALSCFRGVRSEVIGFIRGGSGVSTTSFHSLVVGANRLIVSINAILSNRNTIRYKLISSLKKLYSTLSCLGSMVRDRTTR